MAVWRAARACDLRGIVTPRALALVVQGTLGSRRGLVLAEPLVGADLSAVAAGDPEPRVRRRLARAAGATVGRLHGSGLDPTALHPRVLTALEGDRAGEVGLTGLEFVRVAAPGPARAAEALVGLARGARASTREQRIFLAAYWRAGGERVFRSGGRPDRGALRAAIEAAAADAGASGGGGA